VYPNSPRAKPPGKPIHIREPEKVEVKDVEREPMKFVALALIGLREHVKGLSQMISDKTKSIDEFNVQSPVALGITNLEINPQYEHPVIIDAIIITGPAAATATIQLGDRYWNVIVPATGVLFIGAPLGITLSRNDRRILTPTIPGVSWTFELTGHGDSRGNWP
jgi:hypothetical protein